MQQSKSIIERRIKISSHLRCLKPTLITIILVFASNLCFYIFDKESPMLIIGFGLGLLFVIPTSFLHWNYYSHDKGKRVIINLHSKCIQITEGSLWRTIHLKDIESIVLTKGVKHSKSIFHNYFYFQINLEDKEVIFINSLILHEDDLSYRIKSRTSYFPIIVYFEVKETKPALNEKQIEKFKLNYERKSNWELEEIASDKRFVKEAKIAATLLLTERLKDAQQLT